MKDCRAFCVVGGGRWRGGGCRVFCSSGWVGFLCQCWLWYTLQCVLCCWRLGWVSVFVWVWCWVCAHILKIAMRFCFVGGAGGVCGSLLFLPVLSEQKAGFSGGLFCSSRAGCVCLSVFVRVWPCLFWVRCLPCCFDCRAFGSLGRWLYSSWIGVSGSAGHRTRVFYWRGGGLRSVVSRAGGELWVVVLTQSRFCGPFGFNVQVWRRRLSSSRSHQIGRQACWEDCLLSMTWQSSSTSASEAAYDANRHCATQDT